MRTLAPALAFLLLAAPAFARSKGSSRRAKAGEYCSKSSVGSTATDSRGATLECKPARKGKARWVKR